LVGQQDLLEGGPQQHLVAGGDLDVIAQDIVQVYMMKPRKFTISLLFFVKGLPEMNENGHGGHHC
jgi:hypothetical protein